MNFRRYQGGFLMRQKGKYSLLKERRLHENLAQFFSAQSFRHLDYKILKSGAGVA